MSKKNTCKECERRRINDKEDFWFVVGLIVSGVFAMGIGLWFSVIFSSPGGGALAALIVFIGFMNYLKGNPHVRSPNSK